MKRGSFKYLAACVLAAGVANTAVAQDQIASTAAYVALTLSPPGALSPYLPRNAFTTETSPAVLHLRYGTQDDPGGRAHSFVASGEFGFWRGRLGLNGGIQTIAGNTFLMTGVDYQSVFSRGPLGQTANSAPLVMVFKAEFGLGKAIETDPITGEGIGDDTMLSGGISIPMTVTIGSDIVFAPFIAPGFGWGMVISDGDYTSEIRAMAGGGLTIHNPSRLDLTLGFHKVFIDGGEIVYGVGLTWNR